MLIRQFSSAVFLGFGKDLQLLFEPRQREIQKRAKLDRHEAAGASAVAISEIPSVFPVLGLAFAVLTGWQNRKKCVYSEAKLREEDNFPPFSDYFPYILAIARGDRLALNCLHHQYFLRLFAGRDLCGTNVARTI